MYKRPHHQKIASVLDAMNADFLRNTKCYFGGGTAITLLLGEYRESVDIDFLCSDQEGYRKLRASVFDNGLDELFTEKIGYPYFVVDLGSKLIFLDQSRQC